MTAAEQSAYDLLHNAGTNRRSRDQLQAEYNEQLLHCRAARLRWALLQQASGHVAACGNGVGGRGRGQIDARVSCNLAGNVPPAIPNTRQLADKANGMLVMPLVTEAGLGSRVARYGRGALLGRQHCHRRLLFR